MGISSDKRGDMFQAMAPGTRAQVITPNNDNDNVPHGATLYIGVAGTVVVIPQDNEDHETVEFVAQDGAQIPLLCRRVLASGTDADNIVAIY